MRISWAYDKLENDKMKLYAVQCTIIEEALKWKDYCKRFVKQR